MSDLPEGPNPYDSPTHGDYGPQYGPPYGPQYGYGPQRLASGLPVFCTVMFIIDLVFSLIRMLLVGVGIVGLQTARRDPMVAQTGLFEVATGAGMVLFGLPADIAMLVKQKWGLLLGWVKVFFTLGSVGVGVWQMSFMLGRLPPGSPQRAVGMVGGGIAVAIRLALIGLYVAALVMFAKWSQHRSTASSLPTRLY